MDPFSRMWRPSCAVTLRRSTSQLVMAGLSAAVCLAIACGVAEAAGPPDGGPPNDPGPSDAGLVADLDSAHSESTPPDGDVTSQEGRSADAGPEKPKAAEDTKRAELRPPSPKRALPDYDGRGKKPSTVGQDLLWVPRIVVSPIYFTTEFIIRRPLQAGISAAERANIPQALYNFFLFGPEHKAGIVPTVFFDFGFSPSVGLYGFWDDAGFKGHDLTAHFSIWTSDWIAGSVGERFHFGGRDSLTLKFAAVRRPDRTFFGLGPDSLQGDLGRYGETRIEGSGTFDVPLWRSSQLQAGSGFRSVDLYDGHYESDPGIVEQSQRGVYPLPYGFGRGYSEMFSHGLLALDTRKPGKGTGVRLEGQAELGSDVRYAPDSGWIRYQAAAGAFVDLTGHRRILSLVATALFADPLVAGGRIPFTELVSLGGSTPILSSLATGTGLMPGFYSGRLVDRSAAVVTLQYTWPIWVWLDGALQVAAGNVFGDHLEDLKPGLLRMSGAIGFSSTGVSENPLQVLIGIGSETFDHGGQVDTIRIAFGTSRF
jgi:hypothetical protein